ncbi:MAG: alpha/beta hydrolase-fold protein, partial [Nakamurella sp.]
IYLPPAYLTLHRPLLPVLGLISGQPGKPVDWINSGHIASIMDTFAARNHGLAPVVVMPDPLGGALANPMCLNSRLGNDDSYLNVDVPDWIRTHLQVEPDTRYWAVAGFSYGGTCALQFAVNHPKIFPTFLDIAGQLAPTLGSRQRTIDKAFGGDAAAYQKVNPLDILAAEAKAHRMTLTPGPFVHSAGIVVAAAQDKVYGPVEPRVVVACNKAGLKATLLEIPGGHRWSLATSAVERTLPWLTSRLGLSTHPPQGTAPATPLRHRPSRAGKVRQSTYQESTASQTARHSWTTTTPQHQSPGRAPRSTPLTGRYRSGSDDRLAAR